MLVVHVTLVNWRWQAGDLLCTVNGPLVPCGLSRDFGDACTVFSGTSSRPWLQEHLVLLQSVQLQRGYVMLLCCEPLWTVT